jgi:hypothetical protein
MSSPNQKSQFSTLELADGAGPQSSKITHFARKGAILEKNRRLRRAGGNYT